MAETLTPPCLLLAQSFPRTHLGLGWVPFFQFSQEHVTNTFHVFN